MPSTPACLRVAADGARVVDPGFATDEMPGEASYLWVLWSGSPPTVGDLLALHEEHLRAIRLGGDACGLP